MNPWNYQINTRKRLLITSSDVRPDYELLRQQNKIYDELRKKRKNTDMEAQPLWYVGKKEDFHRIRKEYPAAYIKSPATDRWDGYYSQETVIVEGFRETHLARYRSLMEWGQPRPFATRARTFFLGYIRPKLIIVTSTFTPQELWKDSRIDGILNLFKVLEIPSESYKVQIEKGTKEAVEGTKEATEDTKEATEDTKEATEDSKEETLRINVY